MPFLKNITEYINEYLRNGSLKKEQLQPAKFYGLSTVVGRSVKGSRDPNKLELLPAIISADGSIEFVTPDDKFALQLYHKLNSNAYGKDKKNSYGDAYEIKSTSDLTLVLITNSKITKVPKENIEPVALFGMPERLSSAMLSDLKISNCLITVISSNMNHLNVFKQEFPQSKYFLTEQLSMFTINYKIEMIFSQSCVDKCLCD